MPPKQPEPPDKKSEDADDQAAEDERIDEAGRESFPASDPPSFNVGPG